MNKLSFNENWIYNGTAVTLPHDAMIVAPRSAQMPSGGGCGYFQGGVYEYQKTFVAPEDWADKAVLLQFEGVYRKAKVYLNGIEVGGAPYGYIPFFVPLDQLNLGKENTIRVVADNSEQPNSRWYTGGGIYRPVWLWVGEKAHIVPEGVKISTLSYSPARIQVDTEATGSEVSVDILDHETVVASAQGKHVELTIPDAKLWSDESPYLYTCRVTCGTDIAVEKFGIRKVEWSNKGLFINGKETLLRGGCIHHDNGILGAATYAESEWRRARKLKEAGYNALRISHNPASTAMLEACDALGLYVMDETWDMWYNRKNSADYALDFMQHYRSDILAMVNRDFNHPSVIMYSIGNEVSEPATEKGVSLAKEMVDLFHSLDSTRAVTAGMNLMIISHSAKGKSIYKEDGSGRDNSSEQKMSGMNSLMFNMITTLVGSGMNKSANSKKADRITSPVLNTLDIAGYNYASGRYPLEGKAHPNRVIFGSETFPQDIAKNWEMVKKYPYLIGDFMWTAWDYLGEAGGGAWAYTKDGKGFQKPYPWLLADMGAMDILGNPNGELFWAQAVWGLLEQPKIAVQPVNHPGIRPAKSSWRGTNAIPSWSWSGCQGNKAVVEVYFDCASVELFLNGTSIGHKKPKQCRTVFQTKYTPGRLEAVARDANGNELGRCSLVSAQATTLQVRPEKNTVSPGEVLYIPITLGDGENIECNADITLNVSIENGKLLGFGSANPRTEERYHTGSFTTYYGQALAIVQAEKRGMLTVHVHSNRLSATTAVPVE